MTVIHPKPINQTPAVLLHNASELIQDVLDRVALQGDGADDWVDRAIQWSKDYGAYVTYEYGSPADDI